MNSFALLQDDVEDATDLAPRSAKPEQPTPAEDRPAEAVRDARATRDAERRVTSVKEPERETEGKTEEVAEGATEEGDKVEQKAPPKEKDMTFEEYLAKKAQLSSSLASLNSKALRKANDGQSDGFHNMSVLRKDDASKSEDGSIMSSVAVKEVHENKALKDSTHVAVQKNAEIQSFFKREPGNGERRQYSGNRRNNEGRRNQNEPRRPRSGNRNFERDGQRGDRDGRRGGFNRSNRSANDAANGRREGGRKFENGPANVPTAPNVDDTVAFPSL